MEVKRGDGPSRSDLDEAVADYEQKEPGAGGRKAPDAHPGAAT